MRCINICPLESGVCNKEPSRKIEFLVLIIDTLQMTILLTEEKLQKVLKQWQKMYGNLQTTVLKVIKLIGLLSSAFQVVLIAGIQYRHLQELQTKTMKLQNSYQTQVVWNRLAKSELLWWTEI